MIRSLKDKTTELRRSHILASAVKVFAQRGFNRATIRDVARESGVSDGTIYNYFENKAALLVAALDPGDEIGTAQASPASPAPSDIRGFLTDELRRRFEALTPDQLDLHRAVLSEALVNPELCDLYMERMLAPTLTLPEASFEALAAGGILRSDNVAFTLRALTAMVLGLVMMRLLGEAVVTETWAMIPDRLALLLLDGLAPANNLEVKNEPL